VDYEVDLLQAITEILPWQQLQRQYPRTTTIKLAGARTEAHKVADRNSYFQRIIKQIDQIFAENQTD